MDCNRLETLAKRYLAAEATRAEELELSHTLDCLTAGQRNALSAEMLAVEAMMSHARHAAGQGVRIEMHPAYSRLRIAVASVLSAAVIAVAALLVSRPTVYGYVNGNPVTSLAEARQHSEQMLSDLARGMEPTRDALDNLLHALD